MKNIEDLKKNIEGFRKKLYFKKTLTGLILFFILSSIGIFFISLLEYKLWLGSSLRYFLFFGLILFLLPILYKLFFEPLARFLQLKKDYNEKELASKIASHFPSLQDKLINTLQLADIKESGLVKIAIQKKMKEFSHLNFSQIIDFHLVKKYFFYLSGIIALVVFIFFFNPSFYQGTYRIIKYNQQFIPPAPFHFNILNKNFQAFRGEDFNLNIKLAGEEIPETLYLIQKKNKLPLKKVHEDLYKFTFQKIQKDKSFQLEGAGFYSNNYTITVVDKPSLVSMIIDITPPKHTGKEKQKISNNGHFTVLEGSNVRWTLSTLSTKSMDFRINDRKIIASSEKKDHYLYRNTITQNSGYQIHLKNDYEISGKALKYTIGVIKDQYPQIDGEFVLDTLNFKQIVIAGNIIDDYGFSSLKVFYKTDDENIRFFPIPIDKQQSSLTFLHNWMLDSLHLKPGSTLEFYLKVTDNDKVNNYKSKKSNWFLVNIPSKETIEDNQKRQQESIKNDVKSSKNQSEKLNKQIESLKKQLKEDQKYNWQKRKKTKEILKERTSLEKNIEKLKQQFKDMKKANDLINKSKNLSNKMQKIDDLIQKLENKKSKELYKKLEQLMENKKTHPNDVQQQLEEIQNQEFNLEKELERTLELFKKFEMEIALEKNIEKLDELGEQEEKLSEENTQNADKEIIKKEQKEVQEVYDDIQKNMENIKKMNQNLENPSALPNTSSEQKQIEQKLKEIEKELEQQAEQKKGEKNNSENKDSSEKKEKTDSRSGDNKSSAKEKQKSTQQKQKNAAQQMKKVSKKLKQMQKSMETQQSKENAENLRKILDELLNLSFHQEKLMDKMKKIKQDDPLFIKYSQEQLQLKDNAEVIKDSLIELSKRVFQISSFVTREVQNINHYLNKSIKNLRERKIVYARANQQYTMTSMNNLALMLDNSLQQMQKNLSESKGGGSGKKGKSSSGESDEKKESISDIKNKQQKLGERMKKIGNSGQIRGRKLSEELAKLAAEQEQLRNQLENMMNQLDGEKKVGKEGNSTNKKLSNDLKKAIDQMEQNEIDFVNKRITQELIERQAQIMTRMLEAENAIKEQETDKKRQADSPSTYDIYIPQYFDEFMKRKNKEVELFKKTPLQMNPYFKKEVREYFRRISIFARP